MKWETVIGLEVHIQLLTKSKIFSGSPTAYGAAPNTQTNIVDLGFPGVLPVLNREAINMAIKFGLAVNAEITRRTIFARKNYFYPDLPKGYQISQFDAPIVRAGHLDIDLEDGNTKRIGITRAHLEEDAGKLLHETFHGMSGVDLNRAGVPLLEIVSEPDMRSAKEAISYLKLLHTLVCHLDICDGNMQEGSFRCDVNVSVRPFGEAKLGTRAEVKNVNSFRFIEKAINFEVERQIKLLSAGEKVIQETRLFDSVKNETRSMRSKEDAQDYRYFTDPDLLPVIISDEMITAIKQTLPELPQHKQQRLMKNYQLNAEDATTLIVDRDLSTYFETTCAIANNVVPKNIFNWIVGDLTAMLHKHNLSIKQSPINEAKLAQLMQRIHDHTISGKIAKTVFLAMWEGEGSADEIIERKGLKQVVDLKAIEDTIKQVINDFPNEVADYRAGKIRVLAFLVGQAMKLSKGKANPQMVNELLIKQLG